MFFQAMVNVFLQLFALGFQLFESARPFLRGIRGQLAAVDRKQLITQQTLLMTDQQYLFKQGFNLFRITADKAGNGREVRHRVA